jgi:phage tail sheath protein FI
MTFFHGIKVNEPTTGTRPILDVAMAVIGLVATAPDADADAFPINEPVLFTDVRAALGKAGEEGTLAAALQDISNQASPVVIIVRVAPGVAGNGDTAQEATDANVIGGYVGGRYTGLQALLAAEAKTGVRPRILGCPGLDSQPVALALEVVAKKLRAFAYTGCGPADTIAEAVLYRQQFGAREHMLIYPDFSGSFSGRAIAVALGTRARIDQEIGFHKSLSNVPVYGVAGMTQDVTFDLMAEAHDAAILNQAPVTTIVNPGTGFRFWGNRTTSDEPLFAFEPAVRTAQFLQDTIARGLLWAVDKPITRHLITDMLESVNAKFRALSRPGPGQRVIGAAAWFDPVNNPASELAAGKIVLDYDYTPCAPAEGITLNQRITDRFYADLTKAA